MPARENVFNVRIGLNGGREGTHVLPDPDEARYSALSHADVLVATDVMSDPQHVHAPLEGREVWSHLILDYITSERYPVDHVDYEPFHGMPIEDCGKSHNPWPARQAQNTERFTY